MRTFLEYLAFALAIAALAVVMLLVMWYIFANARPMEIRR